MIYLLETFTGILGETIEESRPVHALKIGYTNDDRGEGRFRDYTNAGLVIRILKTIPGGSMKLEHLLQKKFGEYRIPGRSIEWLFMKKEILDFFIKCESEDDLIKGLGLTREDFTPANIREPITSFVEFYNKFGYENLSGEDRLNFLPILEKIDKIGLFDNKLRYICEEVLKNMDGDTISRFIGILPILYQTMLLNLSLKDLRSLSYRKGPIIERFESSIYFSGEDVRSKIIEAFPIGTRVSASKAKEKLREVYDSLDFKKSPKATDLLDYFNCSGCSVPREDDIKVRDKGYRILSIKQ